VKSVTLNNALAHRYHTELNSLLKISGVMRQLANENHELLMKTISPLNPDIDK